jgi:hypothetical protein
VYDSLRSPRLALIFAATTTVQQFDALQGKWAPAIAQASAACSATARTLCTTAGLLPKE